MVKIRLDSEQDQHLCLIHENDLVVVLSTPETITYGIAVYDDGSELYNVVVFDNDSGFFPESVYLDNTEWMSQTELSKCYTLYKRSTDYSITLNI